MNRVKFYMATVQFPQAPRQEQSPRLNEVQCKHTTRGHVQMDRPETKQDEQNYEINWPRFHRSSILGPGITPRAGHPKLCTGLHNCKRADTLKSDSWGTESRQMCQEPPHHSSQLNSCFPWQTRSKRASSVNGDII